MTRALITTTIRVPTNLRTWAKLLDRDDYVVVAGDRRTPHAEVRALLADLPVRGEYLHPDDQTWAVSEHLGWDCVQRRNVALLHALALGVDTITTVDDDNYPQTVDFFERVDSALRGSAPHALVQSETGWWNAGSTLEPPVTLRGYPLSQRGAQPALAQPTELDRAVRVGVVSHHVIGDPDVDAVERIAVNPRVNRYRLDSNAVLAPGTWCPFNTQATTYTRELAPLMFAWPHVGRYDDVWASYLAQRVMQELGWHVSFGYPTVFQDRNEHDALADLEAELYGMRRTDRVVEVLRGMHLPTDLPVQRLLGYCLGALSTAAGLLPDRTVSAFAAWDRDLEQVL